jgi:aminoglycoside phosphotransferase (APT) family kinase protein
MQGVVPAPEPRWLDADGQFFCTPALIMSFVDGVTKPVDRPTGNVSGLGTAFGDGLRETLANQFVDHLVAVHQFDWRSAELPSFGKPTADPLQAARWQVNWWVRAWHDDKVEPLPTMAVAEQWLRRNLPACDDPVVVHGDFRSGNFLFDTSTRQITAVLDWELSHIGDHHRDLAYILMEALGTRENGVSYATGLFEREWFLEEYSARSGRRVDPDRLRYYEILNCYMSIVISLATCVRAARDGHNHQDTHVTWIAALGHTLHSELCQMLEGVGALR